MKKELKTVHIHMLMPLYQVKAIDKYRFSSCIGSRSEAVRILIEKGLASMDAENSNSGLELQPKAAVAAETLQP